MPLSHSGITVTSAFLKNVTTKFQKLSHGGIIFTSDPSSRTVALGSTQPVTEMSTSNLPGGKGRPARKADNLTVICEPIV
jgi:hypothetical protein